MYLPTYLQTRSHCPYLPLCPATSQQNARPLRPTRAVPSSGTGQGGLGTCLLHVAIVLPQHLLAHMRRYSPVHGLTSALHLPRPSFCFCSISACMCFAIFLLLSLSAIAFILPPTAPSNKRPVYFPSVIHCSFSKPKEEHESILLGK